jgi:DNA-binding XRE family transcriptional regulator
VLLKVAAKLEKSENAHCQCVEEKWAPSKVPSMESNKDLRAAGREIRKHRQNLGLSQEQLAERAGLHRNYVGLLERGERNASLKALFAVARSLGITLGELLADVPTEAKHDRKPRADKR